MTTVGGWPSVLRGQESMPVAPEHRAAYWHAMFQGRSTTTIPHGSIASPIAVPITPNNVHLVNKESIVAAVAEPATRSRIVRFPPSIAITDMDDAPLVNLEQPVYWYRGSPMPPGFVVRECGETSWTELRPTQGTKVVIPAGWELTSLRFVVPSHHTLTATTTVAPTMVKPAAPVSAVAVANVVAASVALPAALMRGRRDGNDPEYKALVVVTPLKEDTENAIQGVPVEASIEAPIALGSADYTRRLAERRQTERAQAEQRASKAPPAKARMYAKSVLDT